MPCCCATNVKAAFVLGIVLAVLSFLSCASQIEGAIPTGIICGLINCILVFGAHTRNSTAILVWIILAILSCIAYAIIAILGIAIIAGAGALGAAVGDPAVAAGVAFGVLVFFIIFMIGIILFQIWTIIIARNANREIEAGQW